MTATLKCHFCDGRVPAAKRGRQARVPLCAACRVGVYAIVDEHGAQHYIGASHQIEKRYNNHRTDGTNYRKQHFMHERGPSCLQILERCSVEQLESREAHYITLAKLCGQPLTFMSKCPPYTHNRR